MLASVASSDRPCEDVEPGLFGYMEIFNGQGMADVVTKRKRA